MKMTWLSGAVLAAVLALPVGMAGRAHAAAPAGTPAQYQEHPWDQPPDDYRDAQRQGFHEGIEAARRDFNERRHKDMDDHDIYKHPPVDGQFRNDFRNGFKHGYDMAMRHMNDEHHDRDDHPY